MNSFLKKTILSLLVLISTTIPKVSAYDNPVRSQYELNVLYAIVMVESGTVPNGNQAVTSVILNRVDDERFPDTVLDVIAQPYQFESYGSSLSWQYLNGNVPQSVKDNVNHVLQHGPIISQQFFWADWYYAQSGRWDSEATNIGGNVFFDF